MKENNTNKKVSSWGNHCRLFTPVIREEELARIEGMTYVFLQAPEELCEEGCIQEKEARDIFEEIECGCPENGCDCFLDEELEECIMIDEMNLSEEVEEDDQEDLEEEDLENDSDLDYEISCHDEKFRFDDDSQDEDEDFNDLDEETLEDDLKWQDVTRRYRMS